MVTSDNAPTFKRAELELRQMWKVLNHAGLKNSAHSIKWNYIVERAVRWGGFYECMLRSVKVALRKTLGRSSLTTEQLLTALTEIVGMINSRPITYIGSETEEPIPLTSGHFIIGKRITSLAPTVRLHLDSNLSSRKCLIKAFNYREKLMRSFWSRWKNEYLLNLRSAHSSIFKNASQLKVNDDVLKKDDQLPRYFWKLGKMLELYIYFPVEMTRKRQTWTPVLFPENTHTRYQYLCTTLYTFSSTLSSVTEDFDEVWDEAIYR
ncbi:integrase catalytic domain-containing protein [Trichonephila clavipes]|nr:integrase catalytic domain-containing protein [Trichonephila clavipes]